MVSGTAVTVPAVLTRSIEHETVQPPELVEADDPDPLLPPPGSTTKRTTITTTRRAAPPSSTMRARWLMLVNSFPTPLLICAKASLLRLLLSPIALPPTVV